MTTTFDLLIRGGTVATPNGIAVGDVGVTDGRIAAIGDLGAAKAAEIFDARGLHVLPGAIDSRCISASRAMSTRKTWKPAAAPPFWAGVTTVFEMPNTAPPTTSRAAIADKLARAKNRMHCDYAFYVGATSANIGALAELERLPGVCGVKAFLGSSTGSLLLNDPADILAALKAGRRRGGGPFRGRRPAHRPQEFRRAGTAANPSRLARRRGGPRLDRAGCWAWPRAAGRRLHVLHVTTGDEIPLLAAAKDFATAETTPQHLTPVGPRML